MIFMKYYK